MDEFAFPALKVYRTICHTCLYFLHAIYTTCSASGFINRSLNFRKLHTSRVSVVSIAIRLGLNYPGFASRQQEIHFL